eukprot:gnl/Chilomastix_cuspidata/4221.p1 GENE.gnl/Chilomastix_cuspidata/4221~~gnl/Chilomastix_cuspidata/4221.p1  ORF type:complete len:381 (+),score=128.61 gnl/Chilomastix_cuspidata/4221:753-1895(+)
MSRATAWAPLAESLPFEPPAPGDLPLAVVLGSGLSQGMPLRPPRPEDLQMYRPATQTGAPEGPSTHLFGAAPPFVVSYDLASCLLSVGTLEPSGVAWGEPMPSRTARGPALGVAVTPVETPLAATHEGGESATVAVIHDSAVEFVSARAAESDAPDARASARAAMGPYPLPLRLRALLRVAGRGGLALGFYDETNLRVSVRVARLEPQVFLVNAVSGEVVQVNPPRLLLLPLALALTPVRRASPPPRRWVFGDHEFATLPRSPLVHVRFYGRDAGTISLAPARPRGSRHVFGGHVTGVAFDCATGTLALGATHRTAAAASASVVVLHVPPEGVTAASVVALLLPPRGVAPQDGFPAVHTDSTTAVVEWRRGVACAYRLTS